MSDHDEHDEHDDSHGAAGHEIDNMPSGRLFNILFGIAALTLVACIGVVQLFYRQVSSIRDARDTKVSFQLAEYQQEMGDLRDNWGAVVLTDDDGVPAAERGKGVHEARRFQMPLAEARKRVLAKPDTLLKAKPAYRGWRNPDPSAPKKAAPSRRPVRPGARGQAPRKGAPGARPAPALRGQPGARPGQPGIVPVKPGQPGAAPAKPGAAPAKPGAAPAKPGAAPAKPGAAPAKPGAAPAKPGAAPAKPGAAPAKPAKPEGKAGQ